MQPHRPLHHILVTFGICLLVLAVMAAINYRVDPAALFLATPVEDTIADHISNHRSLLINGNINERQFERRRLASEPSRPTYVVIGSSRALPIGEWLTSRRTVNAAVPGATLEDLIALAAMTTRLEADTYIVGVDPWLFNRNNNQQSWHLLRGEYQQGLIMLGLEKENVTSSKSERIKDLLQLINLEYFRESIKQIKRGPLNARFDIHIPESLPLNASIIRADGSRSIVGLGADRHERARQREKDIARQRDGNDYFFGLKGFVTLDSGNLRKFAALLSSLKQKSNVIILLPPYHPDAWPKIRGISAISEVETELRKLAEKLKLPVIGSYIPEIAGCGRGDFGDYLHPHELCMEKLWHQLNG